MKKKWWLTFEGWDIKKSLTILTTSGLRVTYFTASDKPCSFRDCRVMHRFEHKIREWNYTTQSMLVGIQREGPTSNCAMTSIASRCSCCWDIAKQTKKLTKVVVGINRKRAWQRPLASPPPPPLLGSRGRYGVPRNSLRGLSISGQTWSCDCHVPIWWR